MWALYRHSSYWTPTYKFIQMVVVVQAYQPSWEFGFNQKPHRDVDPRQDSSIFTLNPGAPHNKYMKSK